MLCKGESVYCLNGTILLNFGNKNRAGWILAGSDGLAIRYIPVTSEEPFTNLNTPDDVRRFCNEPRNEPRNG
jgi:hypothetical protein